MLLSISCFLVVLYKCEVGRPNCGLCLSADPKFECGWCSSTVGCMVRDQCPEMGDEDWLMGSDQVCPDPRITEVCWPTEGTVYSMYCFFMNYLEGCAASYIKFVNFFSFPPPPPAPSLPYLVLFPLLFHPISSISTSSFSFFSSKFKIMVEALSVVVLILLLSSL